MCGVLECFERRLKIKCIIIIFGTEFDEFAVYQTIDETKLIG